MDATVMRTRLTGAGLAGAALALRYSELSWAIRVCSYSR